MGREVYAARSSDKLMRRAGARDSVERERLRESERAKTQEHGEKRIREIINGVNAGVRAGAPSMTNQ